MALGRLALKKALIVVAAQEDGPSIGRIRMRQILDASAENLAGCGKTRQREAGQGDLSRRK